MSDGQTLESLGESFSTDVSEEFTEEEEDTRKNIVDNFFKQNDIRLENYIDDYESMDKVGQQNIIKQADLVLKTRRIILQVSGKAEREYEEDQISKKWREKAEEMHELVKKHPKCVGIYREDLKDRKGSTLKELVAKSSDMGMPKDDLRTVMYDLGELLIEYTDWFFEGTEITTEGTSGSSEDVAGA